VAALSGKDPTGGTRAPSRVAASTLHRATWLLALALAALLPACSPPRATPAGADFVLVRHAEKAADDPRDPSLAPAGQARAQRLADVLRDAPLAAAYATQFRRTQLTAQPAATAHSLQVMRYDAAEPAAALAARLRTAHPQGTVLVVGHSNTVPALAAALCECNVEPIPETEYGRMYRLHVPSHGAATLDVHSW